jgi:putative PIN family toxin of toxin-antitoxin system
MNRIVVDTNVVVAGLRSRRGASFRLLQQLAETSELTICLSVPLVLEYESALRRTLGEDDDRIDPILDYLCLIGEHQAIYFLWRPFLRDPGDEMVLEVAVGARAKAIVTHNVRDFVGVEDRFGIQVISPGAFLKEQERES